VISDFVRYHRIWVRYLTSEVRYPDRNIPLLSQIIALSTIIFELPTPGVSPGGRPLPLALSPQRSAG